MNGSVPFKGVVAPDAANTTGANAKAYLTVLFFDERFNFIQDGSQSLRVGASGGSNALLTLAAIKAPKNGYCYVYVSNESDEAVYFDNFQVAHNRGHILEENHYYSYGLKIAAISSQKFAHASEGHVANKDLYNDKELIDEADLDWYDYGFRMYDAQIGRFPQLDPLTDDYPFLTPYQYASGDPIGNIDWYGLMGVGAVAGIIETGLTEATAKVLQEVVIKGVRHTAKAALKTGAAVGKGVSIGSMAVKALDVVTDFLPGSGIKDVYRGIKSGDGWQVALGVGSLIFDGITLGTGSFLKGAVKNVVKLATKTTVKTGVKSTVRQEAAQVVKKVAKRAPCGCFVAGTLVLTDSGYRRIEQIREGDVVWAYNDTTQAYSKKKVVTVFAYQRDSVYNIRVGTETIQATSDHPFFVGGRWLKVAELKVGDSVVTYSGGRLAVSAIDIVAERTTVHNFEVEDYHTYYVSTQQVLVHNSNPCETGVGKLVTLPKTGVKYFDDIADFSKVTKSKFVSYARQLESLYKSGKIGALTRDQAALLVKQARKLGIEVRSDKGHFGTFWNRDHLNIGPSGYHVPVLPK